MKAELWHKAIDVATVRHRKPNDRQILAIARELFRDDLAREDSAAADRGHMVELRRAMARAANIEEGDDAETERLPLPGMDAPTFLKVPDTDSETGYTVVRYRKSVRPERRAAIEERRRVAERVTARADDMEIKERFLDPFTPDNATTVEDALDHMRGTQEAAD